ADMNRFPTALLLTLCCGVAAAQESSLGSDWPWFLGPDHTGVAAETEILEAWPESGPKLLWELKLGSGYSAPSIRGDRIVVHHRLGDKEIVQCIDSKTQKKLWGYAVDSDYSDPYGYSNGPRCTPILTEDKCFTLGAGGHLACVDLSTGKKIWSRDLQKDYEIPRNFFGIGCTPVLEGDKLIVLAVGPPNSGVAAFDSKTGKPLWSSVGKDTWDGAARPKRGAYEWSGEEMLVSYSSPIAATINGKRHLLCLMRQGLVSLDPDTGKTRFKYWFRSPVHESANAARPVVIGNKVLISAAYRMGSVLLQVNDDGNGVSELWKNQRNLLAHWSTPIVVGDHAYGFSGRHESEGELRCIDLETGKVSWSTTGYDPEVMGRIVVDNEKRAYVSEKTGKVVPRPVFGRGSKILVGDKFIILGERGLLALAKVNSKSYEEISRAEYRQIGNQAWTAPVLSRGRLYLRREKQLLCLDIAPKKADQ
ncbi:MAG: PQQ-binding-like beta-propeller repeat protein, partial [Planctomycetaceae bacterium]